MGEARLVQDDEVIQMLVNSLHYGITMAGEGPALLLLHGFTGDKRSWAPFVPIWSRYFTTIALDLPGHGETQPSDLHRYEMDAVVDDLFALMNVLKIDEIHLLGYSMGGRVAMAMASRYPSRIASMILVSTSPGLKTETERRERRQQDHALAQEILSHGLTSFVNKWEALPLFDSQKRLPEERRRQLRQLRLSQSAQGLANSLRGMGTGSQPSFWPCLPHLSIPTLLITGELDLKFCQIASQMQALLPKAQLSIIQEAGHAVHLEKPRIFDKVVLEFLRTQAGLSKGTS